MASSSVAHSFRNECDLAAVSSQSISFADLSDEQLVAEVKRLAASERRATAGLIRALIELDARRLYLGEGYSSLFTYCTKALHLAEGAAYNRIETARAARRFPTILDGLEDGSLTLTTVRLLAPHLTVENHDSVLASARYKRKQEIEQIAVHSIPSRLYRPWFANCRLRCSEKLHPVLWSRSRRSSNGWCRPWSRSRVRHTSSLHR